jgi:arginine decarboxylase
MDSKSGTAGAVASPSLSDYYNASQLRADTWNKLKATTARLDQMAGSAAQQKKLLKAAEAAFDILEPIETYWAFPGIDTFGSLRKLLQREEYGMLGRAVGRIVRALMSGSYRRKHVPLGLGVDEDREDDPLVEDQDSHDHVRPYFEILVVDDASAHDVRGLRAGLASMRRTEDSFIYEPVVVPSFEDGLIGVLFNHNIQAVVVRYGFPMHSRNRLELLQRYLNRLGDTDLDEIAPEDYGIKLAELIGRLRPELDVYLVTDQMVEDVAGRVSGNCRRVFYNQEDYMELHLNILRGVNDRYDTPFFTALKNYSKQPTGVFHAMPISRGKSIVKSNWIRDMGDFYGMNIFLAETSATSGGLDSLLDPHGPIKKAQEKASRAFGSRHTFFATNGTSTCNKIVVQALVQPGDIVLVDRDCHKSHHYGMVLSGAHVVYLDSYPLSQYSMYGAVPLKEIKHRLLELKAAGKLDRVKMLLLTNCTFDGIVYNVERVMEECLAIKPDLVFLWDEAWFAFARFGPAYRQRTGMNAANNLRARMKSDSYRKRYEAWKAEVADLDPDDPDVWLDQRLMPDPDTARIRVYTTQSTHKTLTSLRQGSMIHVNDQDYKSKVEEAFHEAYMTHTSTSPNYQILASLDVGRRQVELEGFELVQKQVEAAMALREKLTTHPLLKKYFKILTVGDLVPEEYRESGITSYYDAEHGWNDIWDAWASDEFTLDATRLTLLVGGTGLDGDTFKNEILMDRYGIQINKTSRNTVLFMTNIGTTRSSAAYLIEVLVQIARDLDESHDDSSAAERRVFQAKVKSLTEDLPPLPDFSRFHDAFRPDPTSTTPEGVMRRAYFLSYTEENCEYLGLNDGSLDAAMEGGREVVSAGFITPYPPGFPILVPGQVVSSDILTFMRALDVKEIHGFRPELGLRVFSQDVLDRELAKASMSHDIAAE